MAQRFAMLVLALAFAAPARAQAPIPLQIAPSLLAPAAQTPPVAEQPKDEKGPMTIDAERLDGVGEIEMTARGNAEIKQDEMTIFSDFLKYNRELGWVDAHDGVRLQPANEKMSPIFVNEGDLKVQGVVVGLMRRY